MGCRKSSHRWKILSVDHKPHLLCNDGCLGVCLRLCGDGEPDIFECITWEYMVSWISLGTCNGGKRVCSSLTIKDDGFYSTSLSRLMKLWRSSIMPIRRLGDLAGIEETTSCLWLIASPHPQYLLVAQTQDMPEGDRHAKVSVKLVHSRSAT